MFILYGPISRPNPSPFLCWVHELTSKWNMSLCSKWWLRKNISMKNTDENIHIFYQKLHYFIFMPQGIWLSLWSTCMCTHNVNAGTFLSLAGEVSLSLSTLWSLRAFGGSVHHTLYFTFSMINFRFVLVADPADFQKAVCCRDLNPGRIYWYSWVL